MRHRILTSIVVGLALTLLVAAAATASGDERQNSSPEVALGTTFTYQGHLTDDGDPVTAHCSMAFRLFDQAAGGTQEGTAISATVPITDGLFTVGLDFGAAPFDGNALWLGIRVNCPSDAGWTDLGRQALTAAPYALYALGAPWSGIADRPGGLDDGDDNTTYSAGTGLSLAGTQFNVDTAAIQQRVGGTCGEGSSIRVINQNGTVTCEADDGSAYTAGPGLTLAANQFRVNTGTIQQRVSGTCGAGSAMRVVDQNGTVTCETDDNTTYSAGTGLSLAGTQFNVDTAAIQERVGGTCGEGSSIRVINQNGTVTCETDDGSAYSAGAGLILTANQFRVNTGTIQQRVSGTCGAGSAMRVVGQDGTVTCETDDNTTYSAGTGLSLAGTQFSVDTGAIQQRVSGTCGAGSSVRVIAENGTVTCETDDNTMYSAGTGLSLAGTEFSVDTGAIQERVGGTCPAGSSVRVINENGTVTCETDDNTTYSAGQGLNLTGNQFSANTAVIQERVDEACAAGSAIREINQDGQVACEMDNDTTYSAGAGLVLTSNQFSANTGTIQQRVTGSCGPGYAIRVINQSGTVSCEPDDSGVDIGNVVIVAQDGGDFTSIQVAINSISTASASKQYLVWIAPGSYSENIVLKPYIHLQGAGQGATVVTSGAGNPGTYPTTATLTLSSNVTLRDLTVRTLGTDVQNAALLADGAISQTMVSRVTVEARGSGGDNYAVYLYGIGVAVTLDDVTATAQGCITDCYGLYNGAGATAILRGGSYSALHARNDGTAIYSALGKLEAEDTTALAEDSDEGNIALDSNNSEATVHGGLYHARGVGSVGIRNRSGGILLAIAVTAGAETEESTSSARGLHNASSADAIVRGGSFTAQGGGGAYAIYNSDSGTTLVAEGVIATAIDGINESYGLYTRDSAAVTLLGGSYTGQGGAEAMGIRIAGGTLDAVGAKVVGEDGTASYGIYASYGSLAVLSQSRLEGATNSAYGGVITVTNSLLTNSADGGVRCLLVTRGGSVSTNASPYPCP